MVGNVLETSTDFNNFYSHLNGYYANSNIRQPLWHPTERLKKLNNNGRIGASRLSRPDTYTCLGLADKLSCTIILHTEQFFIIFIALLRHWDLRVLLPCITTKLTTQNFNYVKFKADITNDSTFTIKVQYILLLSYNLLLWYTQTVFLNDAWCIWNLVITF